MLVGEKLMICLPPRTSWAVCDCDGLILKKAKLESIICCMSVRLKVVNETWAASPSTRHETWTQNLQPQPQRKHNGSV